MLHPESLGVNRSKPGAGDEKHSDNRQSTYPKKMKNAHRILFAKKAQAIEVNGATVSDDAANYSVMSLSQSGCPLGNKNRFSGTKLEILLPTVPTPGAKSVADGSSKNRTFWLPAELLS
jgi:hypothetical protein